MVHRIGPALALAAVALAASLAACGSSSSSSTSTQTTTVTESNGTTTSSTATNPTTTTGSAVTTKSLQSFLLPSKNIGCTVVEQEARCDISQRSWKPPPRPANCHLDYGQGIEVGTGSARVVCAGDTAMIPGAPILAYNQNSKKGPFLCESRTAGVTCTNQDTGHGFFLSRQSYKLF